MRANPAIWFLAVRAGTGTDVFTERLASELRARGWITGITWLPLRAEYAPWTVAVPEVPSWADIVHVNTWLPIRFLPTRVPVVATVHHAVHHPGAMTYKGRVRAAYHRYWIAPNERRVLGRADYVVAVSEFVSETSRKTLLDVPMHVIYNGIDTDVFRPIERERREGAPFRLLYVGSWRALKGVDLLTPIMRQLGNGFELYYTGGPAAERHKRTMPDNMRDIGRLHGERALVTTMQSADALLFPTRSEGFGLVAAEAMACGVPVVATRCSSIPEIVEDGVTGRLCRPDDPLDFAMAIRQVAVDAEYRTRLAQQGRNRAVQRFSVEAMLQKYTSAYSELHERGS